MRVASLLLSNRYNARVTVVELFHIKRTIMEGFGRTNLKVYSSPRLKGSKLDKEREVFHTNGLLKTTSASLWCSRHRSSTNLRISSSKASLDLLKSSFPPLSLAEVHSARQDSVAPITLEALKLWSLNRCTCLHEKPPDKHYHGNTWWSRHFAHAQCSRVAERDSAGKISCFFKDQARVMADFQRQTGSSEAGGWLVILNKSLADSELHRLLSTHKYRLRGESLRVLNSCHTIWIFIVHIIPDGCMCMPIP